MKFITQFLLLITLLFTVTIALTKGPKPPQAPDSNLMNVVTVSAEYGDYTSPVEAMNAIGETSPGNRYLIVIGPGVYEVNTALIMKEWVTIQGAGREATKITGAVSHEYANETSAIVRGQNNAALTDLTIENRGGGVFSIAIFNSGASPRIERVTAVALGAEQYATGILNEASSSPVMTDVSASASGASTTENFGVYNVGGSSPTMVNVNANATGAGYANPSVLIGNAAPFIVNSVLDGDPGLFITGESSGSRIVNNKIIGGVVNNTTDGNVCRGNYDDNLADVACW